MTDSMTVEVRNLVASTFVSALHELERERSSDLMASLFRDDAELTRLAHAPAQGPDGVRAFWQEYRDTFDDIDSHFTRVTETPETVVLEWMAVGHLSTGRPVRYPGITVLDIDGERIVDFRTYYDSAAFLAEPAATGRPAG